MKWRRRESGEEAQLELRASPYDLMLLDMNMPGDGGFVTCKAVAASSDISIIVLTVRNTEKIKSAHSMPARMTSLRNRSVRPNCWRAFAPCYTRAGPAGRRTEATHPAALKLIFRRAKFMCAASACT